jgi:NhaP-type Na+/H+ and K+/H+ antiporter
MDRTTAVTLTILDIITIHDRITTVLIIIVITIMATLTVGIIVGTAGTTMIDRSVSKAT